MALDCAVIGRISCGTCDAAGTRASGTNQEAAAAVAVRVRADLALFCVVSMLFGVLGYLAFLLRLHYLTQTWYYVEMLSLCAISLDGLLGANWPALRPWGLFRIGFMVVMMTWGARSAWEEAHTRRSNVDLIAAVLDKNASAGDLIVVQGAWEGITFNRYYHGRAHWVTVPPIDSHKVHRNDLVLEKMNQRDSMAPVLHEITNALRSGNSVWVVGHVAVVPPNRYHCCCHRHRDCRPSGGCDRTWITGVRKLRCICWTMRRKSTIYGNSREWAGKPPGEPSSAAIFSL